MYFDTNQDEINSQHEFVIKVKTSSASSSMSLGFMIVEGSETVRLGGSILKKDIDYRAGKSAKRQIISDV